MERRQFIKISGVAAAAGLMGSVIPAEYFWSHNSDLSFHRISDIKFTTLKLRYPRLVGKNARLDKHGEGVTS